MEIAIPIVLGLAVVGVLVVVALVALSRQAGQRKEAVEDPDVETLRYAVPTGQDPASVTSALTHAGHEAVVETATHGHDVLIACPPGQREQIRSVLAGIEVPGETAPTGEQAAPGVSPRRVRFADE